MYITHTLLILLIFYATTKISCGRSRHLHRGNRGHHNNRYDDHLSDVRSNEYPFRYKYGHQTKIKHENFPRYKHEHQSCSSEQNSRYNDQDQRYKYDQSRESEHNDQRTRYKSDHPSKYEHVHKPRHKYDPSKYSDDEEDKYYEKKQANLKGKLKLLEVLMKDLNQDDDELNEAYENRGQSLLSRASGNSGPQSNIQPIFRHFDESVKLDEGLKENFTDCETSEEFDRIRTPQQWDYWTYKTQFIKDHCPGRLMEVTGQCIWSPAQRFD